MIRNGTGHAELWRKSLHVVGTGLSAVVPVLLSEHVFLLLVSLISGILVIVATSSGSLSSIRTEDNKSWGIIYFTLYYIIYLFVFPVDAYPFLMFGLLLLSVPDALAAIGGVYRGKTKYNLGKAHKSYIGSLLFFISSWMISFGLPYFFAGVFFVSGYSVSYLILFAFIVAVLLTSIEAMSTNGIDNLLIPLFGSLLAFIFFPAENSHLLFMFGFGLLLAGIVAYLSFRVGFLTADGSLSTFLLAGFIFGLGGIKWSLPIMTFFILSSLLSKLRKNKNAVVESYFEKSGTRDFGQVFANGGVGGILVIVNALFPHDFWFYAYVASLTAVTADTWATEIGTLKKNKTWNILNLKPLPQGMSGGISIPGTLGGLTGTIVVTLSGIYWFTGNIILVSGLVIFAGMAGSFVDSILGATVQVQYNCKVCEKITENRVHCNEEAIIFRGNEIINNDLVNLAAAVFGAVFVIFIWSLTHL